IGLVIPMPSPIEKRQIHVGEGRLISRLDSYTSPRLVEYFDPDPCAVDMLRGNHRGNTGAGLTEGQARDEKHAARLAKLPPAPPPQVTILPSDDDFTSGDYQIEVLSAKESARVEGHLTRSGYRLPA